MLIVFLAQKSRHCGSLREELGKRDTYSFVSPLERDHVRMGAMKKDVLLILYDISIAQVTSGGGIVSLGHCFTVFVGCGHEV